MNRLTSLISFLILFFSLSLAIAGEVQTYKELNPKLKIEKDIFPDFTKNSSLLEPSRDRDIHQDLDKEWQSPKTPKKIDTIRPLGPKNYLEGTGTRGGGSGLLIKISDSFTEVRLLDIYRSENLNLYNQFFPVDDSLRKIEENRPTDQATTDIFEAVLSRITAVAPNLGQKINTLYREELPFSRWVPIYTDLPVIEDELKHPMEQNNKKVQIAIRRVQQIVYNKRAYSAMKPLNRAALWLHEYLYALSGSETSSKTQRAVSLFFSADFLTIAVDEARLTMLFYELDLLAISRQSVHHSLPPGSHVADRKQFKNCGFLASIDGTDSEDNKIRISIETDGETQTYNLNRADATIILSALVWSKAFLTKAFPLFKYPGQKIMPDKFCFNDSFTKVTQIQSSLAIDEELRQATMRLARAEVEYLKAQSDYVEAQDTPGAEVSSLSVFQLKSLDAHATYLRENTDFTGQLYTPVSKILNPSILREHDIDID